jgi:hypothetical protein
MKKLTLILITLSLLSCSRVTNRRTDKRSQEIANKHIYRINLEQLRKKIVKIELKNYRSDRLMHKQHPIYTSYYRYLKKDHKPIGQNYFKSPKKGQYLHDDPLVHFAQIDTEPDEFVIVTFNQIYMAKRISLLKTTLKIYSFPRLITKKKTILVQQGFPMGVAIIDLDLLIKKTSRDYTQELNLVKIFEPNIYKTYFKKI